MNSKHPKFKELQAFWYKKLKDETDFEDIEDDEHNLKTFNRPRTEGGGGDRYHREKSYRETNTLYYSLCAQLMHDPRFIKATEKWPRHRKIWELHTEGLYYGEIAKRVKMNFYSVRYVITKKFKPLLMQLLKENRDDESNND